MIAAMREGPGLPSLGACFGYDVRSRLPLMLLRQGTGAALEVFEAEPPAPRDRTPVLVRERQGRTAVGVYAEHEGRYRVWIDGVGWFAVDTSRPAIGLPNGPPDPIREARLWGLPAALCFVARGDQSLHAACVEVRGGAIILAAPGRFGKTTFAAGFAQAGHRVLSEDMTCCRIGADATSVVPGPAMLRLRRDVEHGLELPHTATVAEDEERLYIAVDEERRGDGAPVPLRAIVFLREHDGAPRLHRVGKRSALPDLWTLALRLPDDADRARCFAAITALAEVVPVWNVHRRLVLGELPAVVRLVSGLADAPA